MVLLNFNGHDFITLIQSVHCYSICHTISFSNNHVVDIRLWAPDSKFVSPCYYSDAEDDWVRTTHGPSYLAFSVPTTDDWVRSNHTAIPTSQYGRLTGKLTTMNEWKIQNFLILPCLTLLIFYASPSFGFPE